MAAHCQGTPLGPSRHPVSSNPDIAAHCQSIPLSRSNHLHNEKDDEILPPYIVAEKYHDLKSLSRISTLAVKLARESYFGTKIMEACTVRGARGEPPLPQDKLLELKNFLEHMFPKCTKVEFEEKWKCCLDAIGQACKTLRKKALTKKT